LLVGKILNSANNLAGTCNTLSSNTCYIKDILYRLNLLINVLGS
jgi:hypothetical protein